MAQDVVYPQECSMCTWKKVYSSTYGWNVLKISVRSISSNISFKTCVSLLIFCFDDLSIGVSGVLKSPTIIVLLSISPFMSVSVCLGEGNGTPLQYSCLENPMDGGAWWAAVHGVAKSRTWLSDFTFTFFNTPLTPMDRSSKQKINKETQVLKDTLDEMDLIAIFRTFHPNAEYTFKRTWNILQKRPHPGSQIKPQ